MDRDKRSWSRPNQDTNWHATSTQKILTSNPSLLAIRCIRTSSRSSIWSSSPCIRSRYLTPPRIAQGIHPQTILTDTDPGFSYPTNRWQLDTTPSIRGTGAIRPMPTRWWLRPIRTGSTTTRPECSRSSNSSCPWPKRNWCGCDPAVRAPEEGSRNPVKNPSKNS